MRNLPVVVGDLLYAKKFLHDVTKELEHHQYYYDAEVEKLKKAVELVTQAATKYVAMLNG